MPRFSSVAAAGISPLHREARRVAGLLPDLLVEAERVAATIVQGAHGYRRAGPGDAFWQFRRYQSGDPASAIDWRRSARGDHLFIREHEREAAQSVWLWVDRSPSMSFGTVDKAHRAALIGLALAVLLRRSGEHVAVLGHPGTRISGRNGLERLARALDPARPQGPGESADSLPALENVPRHARLVLIGDFLAPLDELERVIRGYRERGVRGCLVQIHDPAEEELSFSGRTRFEGPEGEGAVVVGRVESVRDEYVRRYRAWCQALIALGQNAGWPVIAHRTDRSPQLALLAVVGALGETAC